jgi:hypothetical protein
MPSKQKNPSSTTLQTVKQKLLVGRLQSFILDETGDIRMSQAQVSGAIALLKKCMPDLVSQKIEASGGITVEVLQVASHAAPAKVA